jgi:hypothetical protein
MVAAVVVANEILAIATNTATNMSHPWPDGLETVRERPFASTAVSLAVVLVPGRYSHVTEVVEQRLVDGLQRMGTSNSPPGGSMTMVRPRSGSDAGAGCSHKRPVTPLASR